MKTYELPKNASCKINIEGNRENVLYEKMDGMYGIFYFLNGKIINIICGAKRENIKGFYYLK